MVIFLIIWGILFIITAIVLGFFSMTLLFEMQAALEKENVHLSIFRISLYYSYYYLFTYIRKLKLDKENEDKLFAVYADIEMLRRYGFISAWVLFVMLFFVLIIYGIFIN